MTFSGREVGDEVRTAISGGEVGDEVRMAFSGGEHIDIWMELLAQRYARHPDLYAQSCVFVPTWFMVSPQLFGEAFTNTSVYNGDQYEWKLVVRIYRKKYTLPGSSGRWLFGEGEHPALEKNLVRK
ncbi:hypothetical protein HHK36_013253 [Tetracentron sinense]|uniref:Uncharacterized protein n=1 Tax=Tetracentron sinense TaxID=13715 RepID=A0A835DGE8_TETSI|nr:hypothetical protein HHK36_013253 [Tetracentron sinense]